MSRAIDFILPPGVTFWQGLKFGYVPALTSERYLVWVRTLPSVLSGRTGCVAHHLCGHGLKGKGAKVSDLMTFPLLPAEHNDYPGALHVLGSPEWETRHDSQLVYVAQTLLQAVYEGVLRLK
ncbi:MAG TPA: DUF968 domain-containing protein [Burkholderiales bacterium]|nr:DUF968 domain-containing protein [Burkholderiales bacterium]